MAVEESTRLRFNVDEQPAEQTHLLTALRQLEHVTATVQPLTPRLETLVQAVDADFAASQLQTQSIRRLFSSRQTKQASAEALHRLTQLANDPARRMFGTTIARGRFATTASSSTSEAWSPRPRRQRGTSKTTRLPGSGRWRSTPTCSPHHFVAIKRSGPSSPWLRAEPSWATRWAWVRPWRPWP